MHTRFSSSSYSLTLLARFPYHVQEDITHYLSQSDLHALSLASKYLSSLAARALYANIPLHTSCRVNKPSSRPAGKLRARQFSFLMALSEHTEYTKFVRHLEFEFMNSSDPHTALDILVPEDLVWDVFSKCRGVTSINITMSNGHDTKAPVQGLFPNLKHAKVSGTFPPMTLDRILHTSPRLQSLQIANDTSEHVRMPKQWPSWTSSLIPFLNRTIKVQGLKSLKRLDFQVHYGVEPSVTPSSFLAFLKYVIPHLEDLTLSLTCEASELYLWNDIWDITEGLELGQCLRTLRLKDQMSLDSKKACKIVSQFPHLKIILDTDNTTRQLVKDTLE